MTSSLDPPPPPIRPLGHTSVKELQLLKERLQDLMDRDQISRSTSPFASVPLFIKKEDGTLRLCIDYRGLNARTIRNRCFFPNVADMRSSCVGAQEYTKFVLRDGYYNLEVDPASRWKSAFRCRYGLFEFKVVPFGLVNATAAFSLPTLPSISLLCLVSQVLVTSLGPGSR